MTAEQHIGRLISQRPDQIAVIVTDLCSVSVQHPDQLGNKFGNK